MDMKRYFLYFITIAALTLAGCGGGGGGTSLMVGGERATQDAIDGLAGMLTAATGDVTRLEGELATATGDVTRLEGELGMATGDVTRLEGELGMATGDVTRLEGELGMATGDVTRLEGELGTATADVTRLEGELGTATADVTRLEGELGTATADVTRLEGQLATATGDITGLTNRITAFETAQNASDNATGAITTATKAVNDASDASDNIGTLAVGGNSMLAQTNAQAVLDAQDAAQDAVGTAETARDKAIAALADDAVTTDPLTRALNAAIKVAEDAVEAAKAEAESERLVAAVELVTGDDPDAEGYPRNAAEVAKGVAESIGSALGPVSDADGAGTGVTVTDTPTLPEMHVPESNAVGETWATIVGDTVSKRIADGPTSTKDVDAASFEGMAVSNVTGDLTLVGALDDGKEYPGTYMDIAGTVFCAGDNCGTATDDEGTTLTGSWYFTPTNEDERYVRNAADTGYEKETLYAKYGYWISGTDAAPIINTYAMAGETTTNMIGLDLATVNTGEGATLTDTSADYAGEAIGMSLVKAFDSQGAIEEGSLKTAGFTADVALKATFGLTPRLGGMVTDFVGDAVFNTTDVNRQWEVNLLEKDINAIIPTFDNGTTTASGQDGVWSATGFGPTGGRPTGFFGTFNAHFSNGHVAGAYATTQTQ